MTENNFGAYDLNVKNVSWKLEIYVNVYTVYKVVSFISVCNFVIFISSVAGRALWN